MICYDHVELAIYLVQKSPFQRNNTMTSFLIPSIIVTLVVENVITTMGKAIGCLALTVHQIHKKE